MALCWFADPLTLEGEPKRQARPISAWVGPVMARLLAERTDELVRDADRARALSARLKGEA